MKKLILIVLAGVGSWSLATVGTLVPAVAYAEQFSKEVGEPLKAAKTAIEKRQWDSALASIKKAQAVPSKKPHEEYQINEMHAYVLVQQRNNAEAARVYEQNLNSGRTPPEQVNQRIKTIAQLYVGARNWAKAVEYGNRWIKAYPNDPDAYVQVAQAQHQLKEYKSAAKTMQAGIEVARKQGQTPKENWLNLKLDCQHKTNDLDGMAVTREQLVRYYPNRDNWKAVVSTVYQSQMSSESGSDDRATLNLYRLMFELDILDKPSDYVEMAQMAIETGAPSEAVKVMEKGFANQKLEGKDKDRHVRLLNNAKAQAQTAQTSLAALEEAARTSTTGDADVKLGRAYLAMGQSDKAIAAIQRGLKKGGVKGQDEAQMMLGRAHLKLKQKDQARKAFQQVPDDSKLAQVAQLWGLYVAQS